MKTFPFIVAVFLACGAAFAQARLPARQVITVRVQVRFQNGEAPVGKFAQVEMMDSVGGSSETDKKVTDSDGIAEFLTVRGEHRLRITRDDLETWEGDFFIAPNAMNYVEQVRVKRKNENSAIASTVGPDTIGATQLKVPAAAQRRYTEGMKALEKQQWREARAKFESAIALYDKFDVSYNGLGVTLINLGDQDGARKAFLRAVEINPAYAEALRNLARVYVGERNFAEAAPLLAKSVSVEPVNVWALVTLAYADLKTGNYSDAATFALKAHGLPGEDSACHFIAASALLAQGDTNGAARQFRVYLQEDPQGPNATAARQALDRLVGDRR